MTKSINNARYQTVANIYEYLDPLRSSESDYDDGQTSEAIRSMMVEQKREQSQRVFPELTPLDVPAVEEPEPTKAQTREPAPQPNPVRRPTRAKRTDRIFRWLGYSWWLVPLLCGLLFPKIVLSAAVLAVIMAILLVALLGPEAFLDSVSRDWRERTAFRKRAKQTLSTAKDRLMSRASAIKTAATDRILKATKRVSAD